ncbi:hypothetical protein [Endozoicomonas atrinae]|uniref:hypothetical protein n=1 Tax=Endozoicomonas atrinae TaxID=1333660 RepID=UPI0008254911|nr:hypothetical protein [Endozoicomonas atrinae]
MLKKLLLLALTSLFITGCASNHMTEVSETEATLTPDQGKALVHFMRPSVLGGAIQSTVYDGTEYLGTVSSQTRLAYQADPGKHMFMAIGESADFLEADLAAEKTYYVIVAPRMGVWKARFSLNPASGKASQEQIDEWFASTKEVKPNQNGYVWAKEKEQDIQELHDRYLPAWHSKADHKKQRLTSESGK